MIKILDGISDATTGVGTLVQLFQALRPKRATDAARANANVRTLTSLLKAEPAHALALRGYMLRLLSARRHASLYSDIGVLSNEGFFSELTRRIAYRLLPPALGDEHLSEVMAQVVSGPRDYVWIQAVPAADWLALCDMIFGAVPGMGDVMRPGLLHAIRTLSCRVAAIGLEPKLTNFHTEIEVFNSPFAEQGREVNAYLDRYPQLLAGQSGLVEDARHPLVMLDQCDTVVARIRRRALVQGSSIALTYLLVTLTQSVERLRKLLVLVDAAGGRREAGVALALELVEAHNKKYTVRALLTNSVHLLARNVTENASRTGEHYVAVSRRHLRAMFFSSAGAGLVIGFMALFKILLSYLRAAPLVEAFLFSMDYALGFMFIHLLHFTVATKQPAMTASRIASSLCSRDGKYLDVDSMAELVNKVFRTQVWAVLGNLASAIPTAWLIAAAWRRITGHHLVTPDKAMHLLHDIDPVGSPALLYAAVAGVCLFLAGLISGYYDNKALHTRWALRISQRRGLARLIGQKRLDRLGDYLERNLGGLMGNFYFGVLLGTVGTLGFLVGLPIDIRHVTFSSANFATAIVGLDYHLSWQLVLKSVLGFLAIGAVNLLVSFSLALWVALRSRQVRLKHGWALLKVLGRRCATAPVDFFLGSEDPLAGIRHKGSQ